MVNFFAVKHQMRRKRIGLIFNQMCRRNEIHRMGDLIEEKIGFSIEAQCIAVYHLLGLPAQRNIDNDLVQIPFERKEPGNRVKGASLSCPFPRSLQWCVVGLLNQLICFLVDRSHQAGRNRRKRYPYEICRGPGVFQTKTAGRDAG